MSELEALRQEILALDEQLLDLVAKRVDVARRIGQIKQDQGLPLQNYAVEKNVLEHALEYSTKQGLDAETTQRIVEALIRAALHAQERARVRSRSETGRKALVVGGAGLMGRWFSGFLEESGFAVFVEDRAAHSRPAATLDDQEYDVVVVATPPSSVAEVLESVRRTQPATTLVFDIASIKGELQDALRDLAREGRRVASVHPMFGPATELLTGRNVLVMDCGNEEAADAAEALFSDTTARRHRVPLAHHDQVMAEVLGLAHAINIVFNETLVGGPFPFEALEQLASTTFTRQTGVAREVALENPDLYFEIQTLNEANGQALHRFGDAFDRFREMILARDREKFRKWMSRARAYYGKEGSE